MSNIVLLSILSYVFTKVSLTKVSKMLLRCGAVKKNYLGKDLPIGMGLGILIGILPSYLLIDYMNLNFNNLYLILFIYTLTVLVGFIDDIIGETNIKGLKGHLTLFFKENIITTGTLKAIIISLVSIFFSFSISTDFISVIVNFLILIFTTNSFNLLDVRPGRAVKVYLVLSIIVLLFSPKNQLLLIFLFSIISYIPWDLKQKGMLGDTGSNLLGISLGITLVLNFNLLVKTVILLMLIILHIYTEKRSLSILIAKNPLLNYLDNLGR